VDQFKKALRLEYFTVGYNLLEAVASIAAGGFANSIALVGFGLDSIVESLSGLVLVWRLRVHGRISAAEEERIEGRATRFVGASFLLLGAYVLYESVHKIITGEISDPSLPGIVIAVLSLVVMPVLGYKKYRLGKEMGLISLVADSRETFVCATLSVALLAGLLARYFLEFPLADPLVGLVIAAYLVKEGLELVRGGECGDDCAGHGD
jgi:divalent metal cation (Fe/Co/Zn/Cd) transporter